MGTPEIVSASIQDYAKAVYALEARAGAAVSTNDLAERLGVTPGSVSAMVRKLAELGLLEYERYHGVRLTERGREVALEVLRHHRLIELFLAEELGMPWDRVPIPTPTLKIDERETRSLDDIPPGTVGRFVRVSDANPDMLRYLADQGVSLGERLIVTGHQPFGGPMFIRIGRRQLALGGELAHAMRIEIEEAGG